MGSSGSAVQEQPVRAGPSHEPSPPDDAQLRSQRAALKNTNLKHGESRKLKAAALGIQLPYNRLSRLYVKAVGFNNNNNVIYHIAKIRTSNKMCNVFGGCARFA